MIPRSVRLAEAPSHGKPILLYDVRSKGAESYIKLAKEILENEPKVPINAKRSVRACRRSSRRDAPTPLQDPSLLRLKSAKVSSICRSIRSSPTRPAADRIHWTRLE